MQEIKQIKKNNMTKFVEMLTHKQTISNLDSIASQKYETALPSGVVMSNMPNNLNENCCRKELSFVLC